MTQHSVNYSMLTGHLGILVERGPSVGRRAGVGNPLSGKLLAPRAPTAEQRAPSDLKPMTNGMTYFGHLVSSPLKKPMIRRVKTERVGKQVIAKQENPGNPAL